MKNIKEKVAAGLRKMDTKPDHLLFLQRYAEDWTWDMEEILGIPVLHSDEWLTRDDNRDCPFYPLWKKEGDYTMQVAYFRRAYDEF